MGKKIGFAIIGLAGLLLISFIVILQIYNLKQTLERELSRLNNENIVLHRQLEDISAEKRQFEYKVNLLTNELAKLNKEKEEVQAKINDLTVELEKAKDAKLVLQENLEPVKSENINLKNQIDILNENRELLEKQLFELQDKNDGLEKKFNEVDALLQHKMSEIERITKQLVQAREKQSLSVPEEPSVGLSPIVVRPSSQVQVKAPKQLEPIPAVREETKPIAGKIIAINKDNEFVVIDLGKTAGVKVNDEFKVYRGKKETASLNVIQVRESISACDIKKQLKPLKEGDRVRKY